MPPAGSPPTDSAACPPAAAEARGAPARSPATARCLRDVACPVNSWRCRPRADRRRRTGLLANHLRDPLRVGSRRFRQARRAPSGDALGLLGGLRLDRGRSGGHGDPRHVGRAARIERLLLGGDASFRRRSDGAGSGHRWWRCQGLAGVALPHFRVIAVPLLPHQRAEIDPVPGLGGRIRGGRTGPAAAGSRPVRLRPSPRVVAR